MNRRALAALAAAILIAGCAKKEPAAPPPEKKEVPHAAVNDAPERNDLASLAHGGVLIDRSGELTLELGAVALIDGDPESYWIGVPHYAPQSATIALPAKCRIESIGIRNTAREAVSLKDFTIETSLDGKTFTPLLKSTAKSQLDPQFFNVTPTDASFIRLNELTSAGTTKEMFVASLIVRGKEIEPLAAPQLAGAWSINGSDASFEQHGNHVIGKMTYGKQTMTIEGGADANRMLRLNWIRGNDYGMTALTASRDGKHLSGISWHEEAIPMFFAGQWFGEKTNGAASPAADRSAFAVAYLQRTGRWPLFGLHFDATGSLDEASSDDELSVIAHVIAIAPVPLRLVAHEMREANAAGNRTRAQHELDALKAALAKRGVDLAKLELIAAGSDNARQAVFTDVPRALYSSVDLEIRR